MSELTPYGFQNTVRQTLRYQHGFEHSNLERVSGIFNDSLTKMAGPKALQAGHFDKVLKHMEDHPEWHHLSERERGAVVSTLKNHLGIKES